jgi:membrane-associated phospholipid phosphatase
MTSIAGYLTMVLIGAMSFPALAQRGPAEKTATGMNTPAVRMSSTGDSALHPYHVNYWVSGPLLAVGAAANFTGFTRIMNKPEISPLELQALNRDAVNSFDRWALRQDPFERNSYDDYAEYTIVSTVLMPVLLLFEPQIRRDWLDILAMYLETMSLTSMVYEWSFVGTSFIDRFRPVTYYEQLPLEERNSGRYRNSFYSGHVASAAAATFFMVKVYSDYHPGLGNDKYWLYGAATIPPLVLGYFRVKGLKHFPSDVFVGIGIGALCGVFVPELHRLRDRGLDVGLFASPEGTGVKVAWKPEW